MRTQQRQSQANHLGRKRHLAVAVLGVFVTCFPGGSDAFSSLRPLRRPMTMKVVSDMSRTSSNQPELNTRNSFPSSRVPPGSPLSMICKDQHEFEMKVGHAMDVLRTDYTCILTDNPGTFQTQTRVLDEFGLCHVLPSSTESISSPCDL